MAEKRGKEKSGCFISGVFQDPPLFIPTAVSVRPDACASLSLV